MTTTTVTMSTGGTTVITENDVAIAIGLLTTAVTAQTTFLATTFTPAPDGVALPGSIAQSLNLSYQTIVDVSTHLGQINGNLEKILLAQGKVSTEIEKLTKHAGIANSHLNKANVVAQLAVVDQLDKNQFDKAVVTETQIKAGDTPTVVPKKDFVTNIQEKVASIVDINSATTATGIIIETAVTATTEGFKLATEIVLDTAVGKKLVEYYYEGEIAIVSVFSKEKADRLLRENKNRIAMAKTGAVPTPPVAPTTLA
jgi:hypothetical protein